MDKIIPYRLYPILHMYTNNTQRLIEGLCTSYGNTGKTKIPTLILFLLLFFPSNCHAYITTSDVQSIQFIYEQTEYECLIRNVYHEARNQSELGWLAILYVTHNRLHDTRFPNTHCGVVHQGVHINGKPLRYKCHFSWYCDGYKDIITNQGMYKRIEQFVYEYYDVKTMKFRNEYKNSYMKGITHYHSTKVNPYWAKTKIRVIRIEDHVFYRWK